MKSEGAKTKPEMSFEETAKQDTFDSIFKKIRPLIEEEKYDDARREIKSELIILAEALGDKEGDQFRKLQKEFDASYPEVGWLTSTQTREGRARAAKKFADKISAAAEIRAAEERGSSLYGTPPPNVPKKAFFPEGPASQRYLPEKTWDVPSWDEIVPGLVIKMQTVDGIREVEVLDVPRADDKGDFFITVRMDGKVYIGWYLADMGIVPYELGDKKKEYGWNQENHPIGWQQKEERS